MKNRWPAAALLLAGCIPGVAQSATGRLHVSASIQASFRVEASGETYSSIKEGSAEGDHLLVSVYPGPVTIRVLKANDESKTYSVVIRGGKEDLKVRDLSYDTPM